MSDVPPPPPGYTLVDPQRRTDTLSLSAASTPLPPPGYQIVAPTTTPTSSRSPGALAPTGAAHDGDTFALKSGGNARLFGVDAFELSQTGRSPSGVVVPLGQQARDRLVPFLPGALALPTGSSSYGRSVVTLEGNGDPAASLVHDGLALTDPRYLRADPQRFVDYTQAERLARLNRRGAHADTYQTPSSFRHGAPDPWNAPQPGNKGNSDAVFFDEPTPFQGLKPDVAKGYLSIWQDLGSKPEDLIAYARANGFELKPDEVARQYASRAKTRRPNDNLSYLRPPRVLTNPGDGTFGAVLRGVGDPINMLDESGAIVDSLVPGGERENIWSSDRRFGDIYSNNLDQNRSILDYDDANHPYARFGGQLVGGLALPGASVEGVGFTAARKIIQEGGTRIAAKAAARRAVLARLGTVGAVEGGAAGAGAGETLRERATGAAIGSGAGAVLGVGTGLAAPIIAKAVGRPFSKLAGRDGEASAQGFTDGALDAGKAGALNDPTLGNVAARPVGKFGPVHDDADYATALARMAQDDAGEMPNAIQHPELGPIDLIWGDGSFGLSKIFAKHPEVIDDLPSIVAHLPIKATPEQVGNARFILEDATHRAVVSPDYDGDPKRWLVTAFEKKTPGEQVTRRDPLLAGGESPASGASDDIGETGFRRNVTQPMASDLDRATLLGPRMNAPYPGGVPRIADRIDVNARPRPLTANATDAQRAAKAARIQSRDVLPLPANTVDGIEEAARIGAGRLDPVRAPNEATALDRRNIPSPIDGLKTMPKRGPLDLVTWLRTQGGLKPEATRAGRMNELDHAGIDNTPRKMDFAGGEGRFGKLVDPANGLTYDDAAHAAWEAGYFPDHAERPTISEFLDALTATHSGRNRVFHPDDFDEIDAFNEARRTRHAVEAANERGAPLVTDRGEPIDLADLDANAAPVHAYEEWGENAPNLAGNIRLDKLDSPQAIKRALVATDQRVGGFDAATRGRITRAETANLASDLGMTADDLLKRTKGQAFSAEQALAARQILARSSTDLVNAARRIARQDNAGDEAEAAFKEAWLRHVAIQEQVAGMTAEAGRALQSFRMVADARAVDRVLPSLGDMMGGSARMKDVADKIVDLEKTGVGPGGIAQFSVKAMKPRFKDKLTELYINALLSSPQTHAVNILSNTMTALAQIPEHAMAAGIGLGRKAALRRDVDRVLMSEVGARSVGLLQGAKEGLRQAKRTFLTGNPSDAITKVEQATQRAIPGVVGSIIRTPTRALAAEDEFFKGMARRMELSGLAIRQAHFEGLKGGAATARVAALISNPPDEMLAKSFEYGRYLTFQTPLPHDSITAGISRSAQSSFLLKLVVPFTRTPVNILKFAVERSPAAPLLKSYRADIAAGGARRDLAVARVVAGSSLMALTMQWAAQGHLTGGGPADRGAERLERADGWQPYSLRVGDKFYSYSRLDPLATTLGVAADFAELQSHMTDKQRDHVAMLLATATAKNLSNKVWFSGAIDLSEVIGDPSRYGDSYIQRMAGSLAVPAVSAQVARTTDPVLRETRSILDAVRARVPGLSSSLRPKRDIYGQPIVREGSLGPDLFSPITVSTVKNDPVSKALLAANIGVSKPQRTGLTDAQYDQYQAASGTIAHADLGALIASRDWGAMDDETKRKAVADILRQARQGAKGLRVMPGALAPPGAAVAPIPPGFVLQSPASAPPPPPGYTLQP